MTSSAKKVLDEALALSVDDQRRVVEAILGALPHETAAEIEAAWNEEARRRAGQLERGEVRGLDGPDALTALEARLRGAAGS